MSASRFDGNNLKRVFVNGILNVTGDDKDPVFAKHRGVPLLEYIDTELKRLLVAAPSLTPRDYERILTGMRDHLANKNMQFVVLEPGEVEP